MRRTNAESQSCPLPLSFRHYGLFAIVHSLLDRNVIDMADEDKQEGTYTAFAKALVSIRDDKGSLIVSWRRRPSQRWMGAFKIAWEANCERDVQHVVV